MYAVTTASDSQRRRRRRRRRRIANLRDVGAASHQRYAESP